MTGLLDRLWSRSPAAPATAAEQPQRGEPDPRSQAAPATAVEQPQRGEPQRGEPDLFERAFRIVLAYEGGARVTNDPADPGGLTKYGISQRAHPEVDVARLTEEGARAIYRRAYWDRLRCGEMPWPVALVVYDCGVNQGADRAARLLQGIVGVTADGVIGPRTLAAVRARDPVPLALEYQAQRVLLYAALPGWSRYGLGWTRRAFAVAQAAAG